MSPVYGEKVMEHFRNPRNVGEIPDANGIGNVGNPVCGDIMRLYIKVDENEIITDAKFKTFGCGAAIATSSMVTDLVRGKTIDEAGSFNALGLFFPHQRQVPARDWPRVGAGD